MINQLKIDHVSRKIYIKCPSCNSILVTNDNEYLPRTARNGKLWSLGSCEHFEVSDIFKDPISLEHNKENFQKAVLVIEKKKYYILVVPRQT